MQKTIRVGGRRSCLSIWNKIYIKSCTTSTHCYANIISFPKSVINSNNWNILTEKSIISILMGSIEWYTFGYHIKTLIRICRLIFPIRLGWHHTEIVYFMIICWFNFFFVMIYIIVDMGDPKMCWNALL